MKTLRPDRLLRACSALLILFGLSGSVSAQDSKPAPKDRAGIHGHVYGKDEATKGSKLVDGALVEILNQAEVVVGQKTTDAKGYFYIPLPAGSYFYKVSAPGYREENSGRGFSLQVTNEDPPLEVTLQPGANDPAAKPPVITKVTVGKLRGQIYEKTESGELRGVNGARVAMRKTESPAGTPPLQVQAKAPTEGESSSGYLRELEAGKWRLSVSADGFDTFVNPEDVDVLADKMAIQDIVISRPPEPVPKYQGLQGTIVLLNAPPANPPEIRATITRLPGRAGAEVTTTPLTLDANGKFKVDQLPGRYMVSAEADGYLPNRSAVTDVLEGKYTNVDLPLKPKPAEVLVKVYCGESKKPLNAAIVKFRVPEQALGEVDTLRTNVLGELTHTIAKPGARQVLVTMPGFKPDGKTITLKPGPNEELEFYLTPDIQPSVLQIKVVDLATREIIPRAAVRVLTGPEEGLQGVTDLTGWVTFNIAKQGRYPVSIARAGYAPANGPVDLFAGPNERIIGLTRLAPEEATLAVTAICGKMKLPLGGVVLKLVAAPGLTPVTGAMNPTDARGVSTIKLLEPGRYSLLASATGYLPLRQDILLRAGPNPVPIELTLIPETVPVGPKTGRLLIDVVYAGSTTPVHGARVVVTPSRAGQAGRFENVTDARGKVVSVPLPPDIYTITVDAEGYDTSKAQVTLVAGDFPKMLSLNKKAPVVQTAKLYVQAVSSDKMAPVSLAAVRVTQGMKLIVSGNTDAKGEYPAQLPNMGTYTVSVTKTGFEAYQFSVDVKIPELTRKVSLKPAAPAKRTMNVLVREGGIQATKPLANADVRILNAKMVVVRSGKTNALGRYRADDLDAGVYTVEAYLAGYVQRAPKPVSDITLGDDQPEVPLFRGGENPVPNPKTPDPKQPVPVPKQPVPKQPVPVPKQPAPVQKQPQINPMPNPNPIPKLPQINPMPFPVPKQPVPAKVFPIPK